MMDEAKSRFPQGLNFITALDTTLAVSEGIHEIYKTLGEALVLVIIVVYIFLQGWRATLIPLLAVPVSLIGTFVVFPMLGFSINTLSLFGLVLAIGLVVDDAIVVVEAVEHHIEHGLSPHDATVKAMDEVSGPVVAIALILAAVFIPTAFVPGITGQLYKQFAVTIAISVLFSAFNALTLSPALSAMLLRPKKEARGPLGAFFRWFNKVFGRATDGYVAACKHLIHKAGFAFLLLGLLVVGAGFFGKRVPGSFLPDEDQGYMYAGLQLPDASSLQRSSEAARQVEKIIMDTPGVEYVSSVMGYSMLSGVNATYSSFFFISFKPWDERKTPETSYDGIKAPPGEGAVASASPALAFSFPPPAIPGVGTSGGATFILEDRSGGGIEFLAKNTQAFMAEARKRPELAGVMTTALFGVPQVGVKVDNAKAMTQQIPLSQLYQTLQTFMGGSLINYFNRFGLQWQVYVQADGDFRTKAENLGKFYVRNVAGEMVPLSTLDQTFPRSGAEFVMRYNLFNCVQINASAAPGYSSAQVMAALEEVFHKTMPTQMGFDYMRHVVPGAEGRAGRAAEHHLRPGVLRGLPHHGGAVRKLDAAFQRSAGRAYRRLRRIRRAVLPPPGQQRVRADRPGHADRTVGEERHSDRRVRQDGIRQGRNPHRCVAHRRKPATAANPDDGIRFHPGLRAAVDGDRRRRRLASGAGNGRDRRHVGGIHPGHLLHPGFVRCRRALRTLDWR